MEVNTFWYQKQVHLLNSLKLMDEIYDSKKQEEKEKGRGRPKVYSQLTILKVFVVMMLKKIKTFKGLYRYLEQNSFSLQAL